MSPFHPALTLRLAGFILAFILPDTLQEVVLDDPWTAVSQAAREGLVPLEKLQAYSQEQVRNHISTLQAADRTMTQKGESLFEQWLRHEASPQTLELAYQQALLEWQEKRRELVEQIEELQARLELVARQLETSPSPVSIPAEPRFLARLEAEGRKTLTDKTRNVLGLAGEKREESLVPLVLDVPLPRAAGRLIGRSPRTGRPLIVAASGIPSHD
ncbi:MAG: hypothetical protein AB1486_04520 [Planctomycetota bacterium]